MSNESCPIDHRVPDGLGVGVENKWMDWSFRRVESRTRESAVQKLRWALIVIVCSVVVEVNPVDFSANLNLNYDTPQARKNYTAHSKFIYHMKLLHVQRLEALLRLLHLSSHRW